MSRHSIIIYTMAAVIGLVTLIPGCKKQDDWLNVKRLQGDVAPRSIADYQAILDNRTDMNTRIDAAGLVGTDNLYVPDGNINAIPEDERNLYTWQKEVWTNQQSAAWNDTYTIMEYANIVLDGLKDMEPSSPMYDEVKGQALFYRAVSLYSLTLLFSKPFDAASAATDLGVPIRTSSDVNQIFPRATVKECYDQMIRDASLASELLGPIPVTILRPSKYAAFGLLAKIYLNMEDYLSAGTYAAKSLEGQATLLDFNNKDIVSTSQTYRFPLNGEKNPEIIWYASQQSHTVLSGSTSSRGAVDTILYNSYDDNDLRKSLFYATSGGIPKRRGSYTGATSTFCGIAINEMLLIRAESNARSGQTAAAIEDINLLLRNRYITGTFLDITPGDAEEALRLVLTQRRKELPFTANIRWEDLRRLNKDPRFQVTIHRTVLGEQYSLLPGDPKYVLPIPGNEIQISGIAQNER